MSPPTCKWFPALYLFSIMLVKVSAQNLECAIELGRSRLQCFSDSGVSSSKSYYEQKIRNFEDFTIPMGIIQESRGLFGALLNRTVDPALDPSPCRFPFGDVTTIICDEEFISSFPVPENRWNLTLFQGCHGQYIESIVIEDNWRLSTIHITAFHDLEGLKYLRIRNNRISGINLLAGSFFHPFTHLPRLETLIFEDNHLNLTTLRSRWLLDDLIGDAAVLPCLGELSLKGNPLTHIFHDFFEPLRCSPLKKLNLRDCDLIYIHPKAFEALTNLKELDMFNNFKLFQINPSNTILPLFESNVFFDVFTNIKELDLGANLMTEIPYSQLEEVKETLETLVLSENVFVEMGMSWFSLGGDNTFPVMSKLRTLNLESCRIQKIHTKSFYNLVNLRTLSLRGNYLYTVPPAVMLPHIRNTYFQCMDGMFAEDKEFTIYERVFSAYEDMSSLKTLSFSQCRMATLTKDMFLGLEKLDTLLFDHCDMAGIESGAFEHLKSMKNLSFASCTGVNQLSATELTGPTKLEVIDLSEIQLSVEDFIPGSSILGGSNETDDPFMLGSTKVLNLTGSLINMASPLCLLFLPKMPDLEILDLSKNRFTFWMMPKFSENPTLKTVILSGNHDYLNLTKAMVQDFSNLTFLDLTSNEFLCTAGVAEFTQMSEAMRGQLEIKDYYRGHGYHCRNEKWQLTSFTKYTEDYINHIEQQTSPPDMIAVNRRYGKLVGLLMVAVVIVAFVLFISHRVYANRWYFQYKLAKHSVRKKHSHAPDANPLTYDAFVSYNAADADFVRSVVAPGLEQRSPALRACLHERDFPVGRSVFENIVSALSASRCCVLVVSSSYAKSEWCSFEAQMALRIFREDDERNRAIVVIVRNSVTSCSIDKSLRHIIKLRTYLQWHDPPDGQPLDSQQKELEAFQRRLRYALNSKMDDEEER